MLLADILHRENNNLDMFRLIAACMVIFAHADAILGNTPTDFIYNLLLFDYTGSVAVKIFFFLSGLVVANSLLAKKNIVQFAVARVFRVMPALIAVLGLWAFVFGPMLTALPLEEYFTSSAVYKYFFRGSLLSLRFTLPGVFTATANESINGSLWSIPFEMSAYFWLAALYALGVFRARTVAVLVFLVLLIEPLDGQSQLFAGNMLEQKINKYMMCFAFGSMLVLFKEELRITLLLVVGLGVVYWVSRGLAISELLFYVALFIAILYFSSLKWMLLLKPAVDISYGVYLWGWPSQQIMHMLYPDQGKIFNWLTSTVLALLCGYASWHLVEKHFMRLSAAFGRIPWPAQLCKKLEGTAAEKPVYWVLGRLGCIPHK